MNTRLKRVVTSLSVITGVGALSMAVAPPASAEGTLSFNAPAASSASAAASACNAWQQSNSHIRLCYSSSQQTFYVYDAPADGRKAYVRVFNDGPFNKSDCANSSGSGHWVSCHLRSYHNQLITVEGFTSAGHWYSLSHDKLPQKSFNVVDNW